MRADEVDVIYGTVRLIEKDDETFLAWARESFACVICNLHTSHTPMGIANARIQFRHLIDAAIEQGGSYFLTYHRVASKEQVLASHPRFPEFLDAKRTYDPREVFQSSWYRHYRTMVAKKSYELLAKIAHLKSVGSFYTPTPGIGRPSTNPLN